MKRYVIVGLFIALFLILGSHRLRVAITPLVDNDTILSQVQPDCKGDRSDDCEQATETNPPKKDKKQT